MKFDKLKFQALERRCEQLRVISATAGDRTLSARDSLSDHQRAYDHQCAGRKRAGIAGVEAQYPRRVREAKGELDHLLAESKVASARSAQASALLDRCRRFLADRGFETLKRKYERGDSKVVQTPAEEKEAEAGGRKPGAVKSQQNAYLFPTNNEETV